MEFTEDLNDPVINSESDENTPMKQKLDSSFECNICLDSANEPVVTLCGHLYCWPCIYKWLQVQSNEQSQCPVCKSHITNSSLVPLYGRGNYQKNPHDLSTPRRPQAIGLTTPLTSSRPTNIQSEPSIRVYNQQQYFPHALGSTTMTSFYSPTVLMFGEMVFARFFGNDNGLVPYPNHNSYYTLLTSTSPRVRRQEMEVDKSLSRVSIFLLCCIILCLLLF